MSIESPVTGPPDPRTTDAIDRQFCWDQVLRIRPTFRYSYPYAGKEISTGLLALYALFTSIEELHSRVTDENVARVKLGWWQQQLLGQAFGSSEHPVTRQLFRTGAITESSRDPLQSMLKTDFARLDAAAPTDEHELRSICSEIGLHPMQLEAALQDENEPHAGQEAACAVNGLVQLLRESNRAQHEPWWWVPLNLLARGGLSRIDLEQGTQQEAARQLMMRVCELGLSWAHTGLDQSCDDENRGFSRKESLQKPALLHWHVQAELNKRALVKLRRSLRRLPIKQFAGRIDSTAFGDAWFAWRCARKWIRERKQL